MANGVVAVVVDVGIGPAFVVLPLPGSPSSVSFPGFVIGDPG